MTVNFPTHPIRSDQKSSNLCHEPTRRQSTHLPALNAQSILVFILACLRAKLSSSVVRPVPGTALPKPTLSPLGCWCVKGSGVSQRFFGRIPLVFGPFLCVGFRFAATRFVLRLDKSACLLCNLKFRRDRRWVVCSAPLL